MVVHIVDEGTGFELEDVADPLAEENLLRTSGRGIFLMKASMVTLLSARIAALTYKIRGSRIET